MLKVLSSILCDLDPKVKVIGQKAGICDGVPSTSALVSYYYYYYYYYYYSDKLCMLYFLCMVVVFLLNCLLNPVT